MPTGLGRGITNEDPSDLETIVYCTLVVAEGTYIEGRGN